MVCVTHHLKRGLRTYVESVALASVTAVRSERYTLRYSIKSTYQDRLYLRSDCMDTHADLELHFPHVFTCRMNLIMNG